MIDLDLAAVRPGVAGPKRPQDRIDQVQKNTGVKYSPVLTPKARQARYMKAVGNI